MPVTLAKEFQLLPRLDLVTLVEYATETDCESAASDFPVFSARARLLRFNGTAGIHGLDCSCGSEIAYKKLLPLCGPQISFSIPRDKA